MMLYLNTIICGVSFFNSFTTSLRFIIFCLLQVGHLKKGINPPSINRINFDSKYISGPLKGGVITAMVALAVSNVHFTMMKFL